MPAAGPVAERRMREAYGFTCQALLDDAAVLACMAYVDLNPVRAGIAATLEASDHTSFKNRLVGIQTKTADVELVPVSGPALNGLPVNLRGYLELADCTGRIRRADKRGAIGAATPPILKRLGLRETAWSSQVKGIESRYWRAVGAVDVLMEKAKAPGQCWLKGGGTVRRLQRMAA